MAEPKDKIPSAARPVVGSDKINDARGAIWRRWEPHIHTPGTALNDGFGNTNLDTYLHHLEEADPTIQALGITDYLLTRRYREVVAAKAEGRLPDVKLLFCNVEMRLSIETKAGKGVNLHLLVSPEDPEHMDQLERFLSKLTFFYNWDNFACTESDLRRLGKTHNPSVVDPETALKAGINQFKIDLQMLRQLYEETEWAQKNILVAVAGSSNDGTAGLHDESASFAATRKQIEQFAHIIFTATPKNIAFWRGDGVLTETELEAKYRGVKPCLHGSDAHHLDRVAKPADDRFCWIKGDATFDALRQACLEPRTRVSISDAPPTSDTPDAIATVTTPDLSWLLPEPLPINSGMVAIIGARGSGKTALADLIAHAGDSPFPAEGAQSFLTRARPFLRTAKVLATWTNSSSSSRQLTDTPAGMADVHYLTQQFVDRLCSSVAESDELLEEIKRVVFLAHDPSSRLGADDFESLVRFRSGETQLALEALNMRLDRLSQEISVERGWFLRKKNLIRDLAKAKEELRKAEDARKRLIRPGGEQRADYYTRLTAAIAEREQEIQRVSRQLHAYKKLQVEIGRYGVEVFPRLLADLKQVYLDAPLTDEEWEVFEPVFSGDPTAVLAKRVAGHEKLIDAVALQSGQKPSMSSSCEELDKCSLSLLKAEQAAVGEQIGVDRKNIQRLEQLNRFFTTQDAKRRRLEEELNRAEQSAGRLEGFIAQRADLYRRFFDLIIEQCNILTELYGPLEARFPGGRGLGQQAQLKGRAASRCGSLGASR